MQDANSTTSASGSGKASSRAHLVNPQLQAVANGNRQGSNRDSQISTASNTSNKSRRKTHVGPWRLGVTLGHGSSGHVRLAKHEITNQYAAVKIVSKSNPGIPLSHSITTRLNKETPPTDGERRLPFGIEREVVIMKLIEHPNVLRLYDVWENRGEL
jgi:serine/threonine-protein kinase HSL1, negative regulator of Swe1 kinase